MRRAIYTWGLVPGIVWIVDACHDAVPTVTNDAERVISDLVRLGVDVDHNRVVYRDSEGRWDELVVRESTFAGFKSINAESLEEATAKLAGSVDPL